ncbi:MAG: hypothetical protein IKK10_04340 [Clostridia bacterium]|nr:hypothetical protein [Clostridia bacterium]
MKKVLALVLLCVMVFGMIFCLPVSATNTEITETFVEVLENGDKIRTYITYYEDNTRAASKSGYKTREYLNSSDEVMWSVTVNGTFTYNGTTSSCVSVSRSADAYASTWSIKSTSCSRSGNCATATAIATQKNLIGSTDYTASVNLYCSPYGILS